jgi:hypothetical protein
VTGRVFISYRREEARHLAGRLGDRIADRFPNIHVFMDVDTIAPGVDFVDAIGRAVSSSDILLAMIGPKWVNVTDGQGRRKLDDPRDLVGEEIRVALNRGILVVPILIDGAEMPGEQELPSRLTALARRNAVRLDHETFSSDLRRIFECIELALQKATPGQGALSSSSATQPIRPRTNTAIAAARVGTPLVNQPSGRLPRGVAGFDRSNLEAITKRRSQLSVLRVSLWWLVFISAPIFGGCSGLAIAQIGGGIQVAGNIFAFTVLAALFALQIFVIRKVVFRQRELLERAVSEFGYTPRKAERRALERAHILKLYVCLGLVALLFLILFIISPSK